MIYQRTKCFLSQKISLETKKNPMRDSFFDFFIFNFDVPFSLRQFLLQKIKLILLTFHALHHHVITIIAIVQ